jgi:hypothetical protein
MSEYQDKNDDLGPRGGEGIASSNNQDQEAKESEIERVAVKNELTVFYRMSSVMVQMLMFDAE